MKTSTTKSIKVMNGPKGLKDMKVRQFFPKMMDSTPNPSILMVSKRGGGKSILCRSILAHFNYVPVGCVITPTDHLQDPPFYSAFVPDSYIHYKFNTALIEKMLIRQNMMIEKAKTYGNKNGKIIDPRAFLLMDDCLADKKNWIKDETILELLYNGRHYKIMYILTIQDPMGIPPNIRSNFDYVFLLASDNNNIKKKLYDHYAGVFDTLAAFQKIFEVLTREFSSMVIINRGPRGSMSDKIMWYKADITVPEVLGCEQYINNFKYNYDEKWKTKKSVANATMDDLTKKNLNAIRVVKEGDDDEDDE